MTMAAVCAVPGSLFLGFVGGTGSLAVADANLRRLTTGDTPLNRSTPLSPAGPARAVVALWAFLATPHSASAAPGDLVRGTVLGELVLYAEPTEGAEAIKVLPAGTTLQAAEVEGGWYGARFDVEGVSTPLYFFGLDGLGVYTAPDSSVLRGAVVGGDLPVYVAPTSSSATLDTFDWGSTIQFCVFNDSYYMARVSGGQVAYIPTAQVLLYSPSESGSLVRYAGEGGATIYQAPDFASPALSSFEAGTKLYFADYSPEWLMAKMTIDGASRTVFVSKAEVTTEPPAPAPDPEPTPDPQGEVWVIATVSRMSGMVSPTFEGYPDGELKGFSKGTVLPAVDLGTGWYQIKYEGQTMYVSAEECSAIAPSSTSIAMRNYGLSLSQMVALQNDGSHIIGNTGVQASASDIRTYVDPANFPQGTSGFFQFLVLSAPAGVSVSELNAQLAGSGVLEGQGQAFSDAAYTYGVNEAYLISHAIHETGYGSSRLARGLWYDPQTQTAYDEEKPNTTKVYNMYGIGAYDANPINGGAKTAYEQGWTSVYEAIVGGAQVIKSWYIDANSSTLSGQNTLYKMLWHPEWADRYGTKPWHEYATDVAWAYAQTHYLTQLYADYSNYSLVFEVPSYAGN